MNAREKIFLDEEEIPAEKACPPVYCTTPLGFLPHRGISSLSRSFYPLYLITYIHTHKEP